MFPTRTTLSVLLAGALLSGGPAATFAAKAKPTAGKPARMKMIHLVGKVSAVGTGTLTLTTASKRVTSPLTVTFNSATKYFVNGALAPAATFKVGERVLLEGSLQSDGSLLTAEIAVGVKAARALGPGNGKAGKHMPATILSGTVTASSATSLTIQTKSGTAVTVALTSSTRYGTARTAPTTAPSFAVGERVHVRAIAGAGGALTAVRVRQAMPSTVVRLTGTITAASATSLTVQTTGGATQTVQLGPKTVIRVAGQKVTSLPALPMTGKVRVVAVQQKDGSLLARGIFVAAPKAARARTAGKVVALSSTAITVLPRKGAAVTFAITPTTKFRVNGEAAPVLPAASTIVRVGVIGAKAADGTLTARLIVART